MTTSKAFLNVYLELQSLVTSRVTTLNDHLIVNHCNHFEKLT